MSKFSKSILKSSLIDGQKRVSLIEKFEKSTKLNCIGANEHLILELKK